MTAGYRAGAATVLLANESNSALKRHTHTGRSIDRLDDLIEMLENGFEEEKPTDGEKDGEDIANQS